MGGEVGLVIVPEESGTVLVAGYAMGIDHGRGTAYALADRTHLQNFISSAAKIVHAPGAGASPVGYRR
jgi:hypothetical protein